MITQLPRGSRPCPRERGAGRRVGAHARRPVSISTEMRRVSYERAPLPVRWRLVRDGKVVSEAAGRTLDEPVTGPGNYRVEAWLTVAGEPTIWILSNPVYVRPQP